MEITVLAFGQIADIIGKSTCKMSGITDTKGLMDVLQKQFTLLSSVSYSIAVNKKVIIENTNLKENDTVALLPPFSGG
jgi:molybdopterin synthase sulfur carrier subunit